jgi:hypothetical protein
MVNFRSTSGQLDETWVILFPVAYFIDLFCAVGLQFKKIKVKVRPSQIRQRVVWLLLVTDELVEFEK